MSHQRCLYVFAVLTFGYGFPSLWIWTSYWHINPSLGFLLIELMSLWDIGRQVLGSKKVKAFKIISIESLLNVCLKENILADYGRDQIWAVSLCLLFCLALSQNKSGINMSGQFHCGTPTRGRQIVFLYQGKRQGPTFFQIYSSTNKHKFPLKQPWTVQKNSRMKNSR